MTAQISLPTIALSVTARQTFPHCERRLSFQIPREKKQRNCLSADNFEQPDEACDAGWSYRYLVVLQQFLCKVYCWSLRRSTTQRPTTFYTCSVIYPFQRRMFIPQSRRYNLQGQSTLHGACWRRRRIYHPRCTALSLGSDRRDT